MADERTVVVSGAAGAWGDSSLSTAQLLADGRSDYIIYEGLAEITMAILSRAKASNPEHGYARDLIETIADHIGYFRESGVRVITNAGGVNPAAAASLIREAGRGAVKVAVVEGDDLGEFLEDLPETLRADGPPLSVNAYLGARPIAAALDAGAEIVVTGRVVDSALVLGPLIHKFGWEFDEFDLLSAGSLCGHLLECGPQSVGGLLTDWEDTRDWVDPGFPVAEISPDGTFVLTAPQESSALVDERTVAEQLLYEIGDPRAYVLPDVVCDWTDVRLFETGPNQVTVRGARGAAPTPTLKACAQSIDGWKAQSILLVAGRDAARKARRVGDDLLERGSRMLRAAGMDDFRSTNVEVLGSEDTYGPHARADSTREVVLKIGVHHDRLEAVSSFVREVPSIALGGPPGVSGGGAGLPRPTPLIRLDCDLVPRQLVSALVAVDEENVRFTDVPIELCEVLDVPAQDEPTPVTPSGGVELPLVAIAHARSGDKGADVNIGIRARHRDFLDLVIGQVTADAVGSWLGHLGATRVERFILPGIHAVNIVLEGGLGAGGTASLRFDPQGKAIAQQLLDMPVLVPDELLHHAGLRELPEVVDARSSGH